MADTLCAAPLLTVANGLTAPLYAEGQVVRAADLTLDRGSHDEELWRLRRWLHGWGVVAGLVAELEGDGLFLHRGYGICPSGEEVLLPEDVAVPGLVQAMLAACGPGAEGCALEPGPRALPSPQAPLTVWLLIRPEAQPADLRPALPVDCDHPGNHLAPSRLCRGVRLELACALPEGHGRAVPDCAEMRATLCGGQPVYMPDPHPQPGLLVLAAIRWNGETLALDSTLRRPLLPVSVLQDFVMACGCKVAEEAQDPDDTGPVDDPPDDDGPDIPPVRDPGTRTTWNETLKKIKDKRFILVKNKFEVGPEDPVTDVGLIDKLATVGLGPGDVLSKSAAEVAMLVSVDIQAVEALQKSLQTVKSQIGGVHF